MSYTENQLTHVIQTLLEKLNEKGVEQEILFESVLETKEFDMKPEKHKKTCELLSHSWILARTCSDESYKSDHLKKAINEWNERVAEYDRKQRKV